MKSKFLYIPLLLSVATLAGCTARGLDTKMTPQLYGNGEVVYMYSDLANFAQPHTDKAAEENRLKDLNDWVVDSGICPKGYDIIKRQVVMTRVSLQSGKVYYFIKCKD